MCLNGGQRVVEPKKGRCGCGRGRGWKRGSAETWKRELEDMEFVGEENEEREIGRGIRGTMFTSRMLTNIRLCRFP